MCKKCCKNCKWVEEMSYNYYCTNDDADIGGYDGVKPNDCCELYEKDEEVTK